MSDSSHASPTPPERPGRQPFQLPGAVSQPEWQQLESQWDSAPHVSPATTKQLNWPIIVSIIVVLALGAFAIGYYLFTRGGTQVPGVPPATTPITTQTSTQTGEASVVPTTAVTLTGTAAMLAETGGTPCGTGWGQLDATFRSIVLFSGEL